MRLIFIESHTQVHAWAKLFEVDDVALPDAHPGASVESGGAGDAFGVHAEGDLIDASTLVFGEGVAEEGEPEPTLPPRAPHPDDVDPSSPASVLQRVTPAISSPAMARNQREGSKFSTSVSLTNRSNVQPRPSPHVPEGVLDGLEGRLLVPFGDEGAHGDACGPVWPGRGLVEFGLHHVHPAHRRVAERFQKSSGPLVCRVDVMLDDDAGVLGGVGMRSRVQRSPHATR